MIPPDLSPEPDEPPSAPEPEPAEPVAVAEPPEPEEAVEPVGSVETPATESPAAETPAPAERFVGETGFRVGGAFLAFYQHYGPTLCGFPVSEVRTEEGLATQYFQNLALEEHAPGRVRLKRLGVAWLALRPEAAPVAAGPLRFVDLAASLPRHAEQSYPSRPLADIRYLVLHHTGVPADVGPAEIAEEHVTANGWPGIAYHFLIAADGTVYRTQDLTVVSHHARQFNPAAVGIALLGDLGATDPTAPQLEATADVLAGLLADLGLPADAVRGHREMVPTDCPGERFLSTWKPVLERAVRARLGAAGA